MKFFSKIKPTAAGLAVCIAFTGTVQAATISSEMSGLSSPDTTITFSEIPLASGASVTNEYAGLGVSFSPSLYAYTAVFPNVEGTALGNWHGSTSHPVFSISFLSTVTAASFAMVTNSGTSLFTALLGGSVVESFAALTSTNANNFYGFEDISFDEIRISPGGTNNAMILDNLAFNSTVAPVPVPAGAPMLLLGLAGLSFLRRRKPA